MLHFQGDNRFIYLENMSTLARVDVFCIHNLRHYSALLLPHCANNGVSSNLFRIKVKQAIKYKTVLPKIQIMWHESYLDGEYRCL